MSIENFQRDVHRRQKEIARLQQEKSREAANVAEENKRANSDAESASRANSTSMKQSKLRDVQRHQDAAVIA